MDIVVKGRNVAVPEHFRSHVGEKLTRLERYDKKVMRYEVELVHEPNRKQAKNCQRIEITGKGRATPLRAEACAGDFYSALDAALHKLENRMRKLHDRRRVHYGRRAPKSVVEATSVPTDDPAAAPFQDGRRPAASTAVLDEPAEAAADTAVSAADVELPEQRWDDGMEDHVPGRVVREKRHSAEPMTVDDALYQMELVGHDFYLFHDKTADRPSVVYRRKGFDYGVITLG